MSQRESLSSSGDAFPTAAERVSFNDSPLNPVDLLHNFYNIHLSRESDYIRNRRYIHMPDPEFRLPMPATKEQTQWAVFERFKTAYISITHPNPKKYSTILCVHVLIPKDILSGKAQAPFPMHVRFHGGGFCTGSPSYAPWFALHVRNLMLEKNCITLLPEYRKMPESHGVHILQDIDTFWGWYQSPKLESDLASSMHDLSQGGKTIVERLDKRHLLVSGESAGGFLAAYSWLSQPNLRINAMYLQYPMLKQYTRNAGNPYRGVPITESTIQSWAELYCNHIMELKKAGLVSPRMSSDPPEGMDMAYMLSSSKKDVLIDGDPVKISYWQWWFNQPDIIERLRDIVDRKAYMPAGKSTEHTDTLSLGPDTSAGSQLMVAKSAAKGKYSMPNLPSFSPPKSNHSTPAYCPAIFISHGANDTNCPIRDSEEFLSLVQRVCPDAYLHLAAVPGEAHAFDYTLGEDESGNEWLRVMLESIGEAWCAPEVVSACPGGADSDTVGTEGTWAGAPAPQEADIARVKDKVRKPGYYDGTGSGGGQYWA